MQHRASLALLDSNSLPLRCTHVLLPNAQFAAVIRRPPPPVFVTDEWDVFAVHWASLSLNELVDCLDCL
ncbi:hypothetical protein PISMIDRAFT_677137 [Pisolithus microcarpus 441]|uniref:Uncharacterized protein n=1 Tax=Pisolithus microcarpus 441 TaxID=765257 RepID=A0A0C9Z8A2_9AGAM|nr:hypothetical protein PISMIDRAFT_677137 [Pisolithus microcarpus 441]